MTCDKMKTLYSVLIEETQRKKAARASSELGDSLIAILQLGPMTVHYGIWQKQCMMASHESNLPLEHILIMYLFSSLFPLGKDSILGGTEHVGALYSNHTAIS